MKRCIRISFSKLLKIIFDFYSLVQHLGEKGKLKAVMSSDEKNCSTLLKQTAKDKIQYMYDLKDKLEYKFETKKSTT